MRPNQQEFTGALIGGVIVIAVYLAFSVGQKVWHWLKGVINTLLRAVRALEALTEELAYIRNLSGGMTGDQQIGGDPSEARSAVVAAQQQAAARGNAVPFPETYLDRFPQETVRDATLEDTDVDLLKQTDEDLVEIERLDQMRKFGMVEDDPGTIHPGIVAEAK